MLGRIAAVVTFAVMAATSAGAAEPEIVRWGPLATRSAGVATVAGESSPGGVARSPGRYAAAIEATALLALSPGDVVALHLPRGPRRSVRLARIERAPSGAASWFGDVVDASASPDGGTVILTIRGRTAAGLIRTADGDFTIDTDRDGTWLTDIEAAGREPAPPASGDDARAPTTAPPATSTTGAATTTARATTATTATTATRAVATDPERSLALAPGLVLPRGSARKSTLDLLVLYTPGLRARLGDGLEVRLDHLVAVANEALTGSGVHAKLRLVHAEQVAYPDRGSNSDALGPLTSGSHPGLAGVAAMRDLYGADLVTLLRPFDNATHGGCGTGWIGGFGGVSIDYGNAFAYSVVSDGESQGLFCDDVSFVHEIAHNLGCMHDRATAAAQGGGQGAYAFGFGYGVPGVFGTIMSYVFPRVVRFSNPDILCLGLPCGIDALLPNAADNARAIELTRAGVARYRPDAQLDFGFGTAGRALREVAGGRAVARAVALQPDGGVVIAGAVERGATGDRSAFAVARFLADGTPDPSFGTGGLVEHEIPNARGGAEAVAVQADGKIALAGWLREGSSSALAVLRLTSEGALDDAFADGGLLRVARAARRLEASSLAVDAGGRMLVAGTAEGTGSEAGASFAILTRIRARGSVDRFFGKQGIAEQAIPGGAGRIAAMALAPDGGVALAGESSAAGTEAGERRLLVMRLDATGALDAGWGTGGVALVDLGGEGGAEAVAIAPDGAVLAAGSDRSAPTAGSALAVLRWTPEGRLDPGFGTGGVFELALGDGDTRGAALALAAGGRIVVGGSFRDASSEDADFIVLRLRDDGRLDRTFATGGVAATNFPGSAATVHAIALQADDGNIVAIGDAADGPTAAFAATRHRRRPFQR